MKRSHSVVFYLEQVECIDESDLTELLPFLSSERQKTIENYRFSKDRVQSALAYLLFRYGLIRAYRIADIPHVSKSEYGKPFLADYPHIFFNFSHCKKAVACGFGSSSIGIDVQHITTYKAPAAKYFMTPEEHETVLKGDRDSTFTALWSQKESYGKFLGKGISYDMASTPVSKIPFSQKCQIYSYEMDGYFLSICAREEPVLRKVSFPQLKEMFLQIN